MTSPPEKPTKLNGNRSHDYSSYRMRFQAVKNLMYDMSRKEKYAISILEWKTFFRELEKLLYMEIIEEVQNTCSCVNK